MYAQWGEADTAFEWLDRAYETHDSGLVEVKFTRELDPIRDDPRFQALEKKMGFPDL